MSNKAIAIGDVVVISRAMFRGKFTVAATRWTARDGGAYGLTEYLYLVHETHSHENGWVRADNCVLAKGLYEVEYQPHVSWHEIWQAAHDGGLFA